MIDHATIHNDGTWGVSHNETRVILKVTSFNGTDRIGLCAREVDEIIEELTRHREEMMAGTWCGSPTEGVQP